MGVAHTLTDNYYALTIAILNPNHTIDTAIDCYSTVSTKKNHPTQGKTRKFDVTVVIEMIRLKKTMTYKEIGRIYGLKADAVYNRIRRYIPD